MKKTLSKNKKVRFRINLIFPVIMYLSLSAFISCNFYKKENKHITADTGTKNNFPYDLNKPDNVYDLPEFLEEISGISYYKENMIACVQDENAIIYIFDIEKEKIISKYDFGKNGDYEDIAIVGNNAFILRSDGTIFIVENFDKSQNNTIKIKTSLNKKNNTEGLLFDKSTNSLLISCKYSPSLTKDQYDKSFKAIYRFDLKNNRLIEKPAYLINISNSNNLKNTGTIEKHFIEIAKKLKLINDGNDFHPSGIAIHPINNGYIYMISNVGKLLIVMNKQELIINIIELDKRIFNQPEGICFSENGDMYISNEGKNGKGNILKFKFIEKN